MSAWSTSIYDLTRQNEMRVSSVVTLSSSLPSTPVLWMSYCARPIHGAWAGGWHWILSLFRLRPCWRRRSSHVSSSHHAITEVGVSFPNLSLTHFTLSHIILATHGRLLVRLFFTNAVCDASVTEGLRVITMCRLFGRTLPVKRMVSDT